MVSVTKNFLLDKNLPFKFKLYLWYLFIAGALARFDYLKYLGIK